MPRGSFRPALRPVETIVVPDAEHGRVVVLRDTQGVTAAHASIPQQLIPVVARFTGEQTCAEIARDASRELGRPVTAELVERVARELEEGLFLDGERFLTALEGVRAAFRGAGVRPASHAGGAYASNAAELRGYLDDKCLAQGMEAAAALRGRTLRGLVAPHIDPWRGAVGYGHAYAALRDGLAPEADTFIVFGTSHAPMDEPFALCRKGFETPLGTLDVDGDAVDALAARCPYDPYTDLLNHKREHSIEFQAVFLRHVLADRPARIIPILAGLGRHQALGTDPGADARSMALLDAVRELVARLGPRAVVIAGADLAHVGPRFGDRAPFDAAGRERLRETDAASLALTTAGDAHGFWQQVASDLGTRRVCGLAPIYATLQVLGRSAGGDILHYEQTVDPDEGSIVSHAAVALYG
jgi:AmmeMemoRadiSam system protein B